MRRSRIQGFLEGKGGGGLCLIFEVDQINFLTQKIYLST